MSQVPYNPALFAADLVHALDEVERWKHVRPHFNEKAWARCLAQADEHDHARAWRAKCEARDAARCPPSRTVAYYDKLYASTALRMNGKIFYLSAADPEFRTLVAIKASS